MAPSRLSATLMAGEGWFEALPIPLLAVDKKGIVRQANESAHSFFSSFGALLGINFFSLLPECAKMANKWQSETHPLVEQLINFSTSKDGRQNDCLTLLFGNEQMFYLLFIDISPWLHHLRIESLQQEAMNERAHLREWAHEVNNPLGGMLAGVQWWQKSILPQLSSDLAQETSPLLEMMLSEINRLRALTTHLLGRKVQEQTAINIHECLEAVWQVMRHEFPAIHIHRDYDVSLPEIVASRPSLQQAFMNLARNAGQALQRAQIADPHINIRTRATNTHLVSTALSPAKSSSRLALQIDIEDNGPGMPKNPLEAPHGHGLGLTITRRIIRDCQGDLRFYSLGSGTIWTIILPCAYGALS